MSKSPVFTKGQRVRCQKSNVEFVVEAQANAVVIGRTMQIVYGSCGEWAFADDCSLVVNDHDDSSMKRAHQAENLEFASIIWEYEVNVPKPLMRAEAERRIAAHLDAFRLTVETERDLYVGRCYEDRIERLQQEINELKRASIR